MLGAVESYLLVYFRKRRAKAPPQEGDARELMVDIRVLVVECDGLLIKIFGAGDVVERGSFRVEMPLAVGGCALGGGSERERGTLVEKNCTVKIPQKNEQDYRAERRKSDTASPACLPPHALEALDPRLELRRRRHRLVQFLDERGVRSTLCVGGEGPFEPRETVRFRVRALRNRRYRGLKLGARRCGVVVDEEEVRRVPPFNQSETPLLHRRPLLREECAQLVVGLPVRFPVAAMLEICETAERIRLPVEQGGVRFGLFICGVERACVRRERLGFAQVALGFRKVLRAHVGGECLVAEELAYVRARDAYPRARRRPYVV